MLVILTNKLRSVINYICLKKLKLAMFRYLSVGNCDYGSGDYFHLVLELAFTLQIQLQSWPFLFLYRLHQRSPLRMHHVMRWQFARLIGFLTYFNIGLYLLLQVLLRGVLLAKVP